MTPAVDFEVVPLGEVAVERVLEVLSDAFEDEADHDWYRWKHLEGPWGPSHGWVAQDAEGVLGVLCCLPWPLQVGNERIVASRMVDGGTTVRARRRGVFSALVAREVEEVALWAEPLVFGTATPEAAVAHVRNGATALPALAHRYGVPSPSRPVPLEHGRTALHAATAVGGPVATAWDGASMHWRLDPRSGLEYRVSATADGSSGAAFRVISRRGLRTLVLTHVWGPRPDRPSLISSIARRERCPTILGPASGGQAAGWHPLIRRGASLLVVWDFARQPSGVDLRRLESWAMTGADLEGVV
jgi:hypothetical protein